MATQGAGLGTGRTGSGAQGQAVKFARFDAVPSDLVEIVIGDVVLRVGGDVETAKLYTKIGQLTVERDFLARRRALSLTERASVSDVTTLQVQRDSTLTLQNFRSL
ncbi:hypothetical protein ACVWXQ_000019 [Bradyrhizobium sp. S3.14.4]